MKPRVRWNSWLEKFVCALGPIGATGLTIDEAFTNWKRFYLAVEKSRAKKL